MCYIILKPRIARELASWLRSSKLKSSAFISRGNYTGQIDFCNWLADGIMWLALHSFKSINVNILIQIRTSQSNSYPIVLTRLGRPCSRPNLHCGSAGVEPEISWLVDRHAAPRPMFRSSTLNMRYGEVHQSHQRAVLSFTRKQHTFQFSGL